MNGTMNLFGLQVLANEDIFEAELEYRLHRIKTHYHDGEAVADIYDGEQPVFSTHGFDLHKAIAKAKQWIDEQEEPVVTYDLHAA